MAYITVSPNPVGIRDLAFGGYASGTWDVQDGPQEVRAAEVVVSINGAPTVPFVGPGFFGRFVYPVNLPNTYEFVLRYADTKSELTRVEVQTYQRHAGIEIEYSPDIPTTVSTSAGAGGGRGGFEAPALAIDGNGQLLVRESGDEWSVPTGGSLGSTSE